MCLMTMREKTQ